MSRFSVRGLQQRPRQRGVALAVALILLLVITLVGLAAVSGTLMQQKMSANFYDRQIAFQSTEAAMRQAALAIQTATASAAAPAGFYDCSPAAPNGTGAGNVCQSNPFATCPTGTTCSVGTIVDVSPTSYKAGNMATGQPQYIVQYMGNFQLPTPNVNPTSCPPGQYGCKTGTQTADFYRITARSGDPSVIGGRADVVLQSMFRN